MASSRRYSSTLGVKTLAREIRELFKDHQRAVDEDNTKDMAEIEGAIVDATDRLTRRLLGMPAPEEDR